MRHRVHRPFGRMHRVAQEAARAKLHIREQVGRALEKLPGVQAIHHLHIWSISTTETALTVHLVAEEGVDRDRLIRQSNAYVHDMFGISHSTIQVESADMDHDDDCHGHGHGHGH